MHGQLGSLAHAAGSGLQPAARAPVTVQVPENAVPAPPPKQNVVEVSQLQVLQADGSALASMYAPMPLSLGVELGCCSCSPVLASTSTISRSPFPVGAPESLQAASAPQTTMAKVIATRTRDGELGID
jgi:hypothetical protein